MARLSVSIKSSYDMQRSTWAVRWTIIIMACRFRYTYIIIYCVYYYYMHIGTFNIWTCIINNNDALNGCGKCVPNFTPLRLLSRTRAHSVCARGSLMTRVLHLMSAVPIYLLAVFSYYDCHHRLPNGSADEASDSY